MSDLINTSDYGVLPAGFARMRLPEIRQAIIDSLQAKTGLTFETRPDSITGQFIDVFAEREATVWELAQAVYHAMYPISAYGVNLDHSVSFAGVVRLFALQSIAWVNLYGNQGTIILSGAIVRSETNREDFTLQDDVVIDSNAIGDVTFSVDTAVAGQMYSITLTSAGGTSIVNYAHTAVVGDTNVSIAGVLAPHLVTSDYIVVQDANLIRVYRIDGILFQATNSAGISRTNLGATGLVKAINYGPIDIPIGSITQIISSQDGWDSVYNVTPGQMGRETETDDLLRQRYNRGVYRLGAATLPGILANLEQNILGLLSVSVYENEDDVTDSDGRPPHSIEVVAYGGDPQSIGEEIFRTKAAGIESFGSIHVNVSDSAGYTHVINFNRPVPVYVWINITVSKYMEETFPSNGDDVIKDIIVETGNSFGVGKDLLHQRFHGPIYSQVSGIGTVVIYSTITYDLSTGPDPFGYTIVNKAIAVRELSRFDKSRIQITVV